MKKLYLITFYDDKKSDLFSVKFYAHKESDCVAWFDKNYQGCDLLLIEDITLYPIDLSCDFDD